MKKAEKKPTKELVKVDPYKLAKVAEHIQKTGQTIKGFVGLAIDEKLIKESSR